MSSEREDVKIFFGQSVRAYENGIVEGYLVPFTGPDQKDYYRTYFDQATDYGFDYFPVVNAPALYQHGNDATLEVRGLGRIISKRIDDVGLWVQAQLDLKDEYEKAVHTLARRGLFSWSSGAMPQSVRVADDGHVERWYIVEASLTPTPGTPDGRTKISTVRSLPPLPSLKELMTTVLAEGGHGTQDESARAVDVLPAVPTTEISAGEAPAEREVAMTRDEMKALLAELLAEMGLAPMAEREEMAVVEEVEAELGRMGAPEELQEEQMRSLAKFAVGAINKQREARQTALRGIAASAVEDARNAPGVSKIKAGGSRAAEMAQTARAQMGGNGVPNISVSSPYDRYTQRELALAALVQHADLRKAGINPSILPNGGMDEQMMRALAHKTHERIHNRRGQTMSADSADALRSIAPSFRANELDNSSIAGQGLEWISVTYGSEVWEAVREIRIMDRLIAKGMQVKEVPLGSNKAIFYTEGSDPQAYNSPEARSVDATGRPEVVVGINPFGTGQVEATLAYTKIASSFTQRLQDSSPVDIARQLNYQMTEKAAETAEQLLLNGDTATAANTNINKIDGTPASGVFADYYLGLNGMRKFALVTNTSRSLDAAGLINKDTYKSLLGLLPSKVRARKDRLIYVQSAGAELAALGIPELLTRDVAGERFATIEGGEFIRIWGVDSVPTGFILPANTAGKVSVTDGNNVTGTVALIYAPYWGFGFQRAFNLEVVRDPLSDTTTYVGGFSMSLVPRSNDALALAYNTASDGV